MTHTGVFFFACEKSRTFARSEEEETNERHERAKTADFKAESILVYGVVGSLVIPDFCLNLITFDISHPFTSYFLLGTLSLKSYSNRIRNE